MTDPTNSNWAQPEGGSKQQAPAPNPLVAPRKKQAGGNLTNILLIVAALVGVGGIAFAGGRATAPVAASGRNGQGFPNRSFTPGQGGPGGFGDRAVTVRGTVKSVSGTTLVITTADGSETTIDTSSSTYHTQAAAAATDVAIGASVQVSVTGFGGFRPDASGGPGGPGGPGDPGANGGPAAGGAIAATDVMILAR
ncbi:MAG: hypothetical protein WCK58_17975 [Chloroflexota bacterium]